MGRLETELRRVDVASDGDHHLHGQLTQSGEQSREQVP
jgi:hypothetical protein